MSNRPDSQEIEWLKLLRQNDQAGMAKIFGAYYAPVYRAVLRVVKDDHVAEDLAQDVFFDLWRRRAELNITTSLIAYLRRAGVNRTLNYIRDRKVKWDDEDKLPFLAANTPDAVQMLEGEDLKKLIDATIDNLPERCRLIFTLSRYEELSYQQIAGELGISVKTVENQMSKALKILRSVLAPHTNRR